MNFELSDPDSAQENHSNSSPGTNCPSDEELLDLIDEVVSSGPLSSHFANCQTCRQRLSDLQSRDDRLRENLPDFVLSGAEVSRDPEIIGRYRVISRLGDKSGQAVVYRVIHPTLEAEMVLKLSRTSLSGTVAQDFLVREGRLLCELKEPGLARVLDLGFYEGRPFLVLEYIRGRSVERLLHDNRPSPAYAASLVAAAARAIHRAHMAGVLHRDLKPANLILSTNGEPQVIDFGLALIADATRNETDRIGSVSGTVSYMAPEQAAGETYRIGPLTDVFGLGAVLYALLTGKAPYPGTAFEDPLEQARLANLDRAPLRKHGIPKQIARECLKAMSAEPVDRHSSAQALADALDVAIRSRWPSVAMITGCLTLLLIASLAIWNLMTSGVPQRPPLELKVHRQNQTLDVWDAVPLLSVDERNPDRGDRLQLTTELPANLQTSAFWLDSDGQLFPLETKIERTTTGQLVTYPREGVERLAGSPGTEALIVVGRPGEALTFSKIKTLIGDDPWPAVPENVVLIADQQGLQTRTRSTSNRGPGGGESDPQAATKARLEQFTEDLKREATAFVVLVFPHGS